MQKINKVFSIMLKVASLVSIITGTWCTLIYANAVRSGALGIGTGSAFYGKMTGNLIWYIEKQETAAFVIILILVFLIFNLIFSFFPITMIAARQIR